MEAISQHTSAEVLDEQIARSQDLSTISPTLETADTVLFSNTISPRSVKQEETFWVEGEGRVGDLSIDLLTDRSVIQMTDDEHDDMMDDVAKVELSLRKLRRTAKRNGLSVIYKEQEVAGKKIHVSFSEERALVMLLALGMTQSGKTGVMVSAIEQFLKSGSPVPIENIFIISGLSSVEWKDQTKNRVPVEIHGNIFHRPQLKGEFMEKVRGKKNVLILIDEVQIACKENQTIASVLEGSGLLEMQNLLMNDIKIVEFSATPNGTLYDTEKWNSHSTRVKVEAGEGYMGCIDLNKGGRVKQCEPLTGDHLVEVEHTYQKIKDVIDGFQTPRYHIIRTPTGDQQGQIIAYFSRFFKLPYRKFDMTKEGMKSGSDINAILSEAPEKHTFIFIKEKARCAKTFVKTHIGIWYERYANTMMDDVVTQGLLGRATGYDDNGDSIIFTHIDSIHKYQKLWDSNFDADVEWQSSSTLAKNEQDTLSSGTFNRNVKNGGVFVIPETPKREKWYGLPDTHDIRQGVINYEGDGSTDSLIQWFKENAGERQQNPFKKMAKKGEEFASPMQKFGKNPILKKDLLRKVTSWTKKNNQWVIESFSIKAEDVNNPGELPFYGLPTRKAYVCYNSFNEGEGNKPVLYWRELYHN
jgi:hypothetical protein